MEEKETTKIIELDKNSQKYLTFRLTDEDYAFPISLVQEVIRMSGVNITKVPRSPEYIQGVMNLRGKVIPLVDLIKKLSLKQKKTSEEKRVIVVDIDDKKMGLIVDDVHQVISLQNDKIEPLPELVTDVDTNYVSGIGRVEERIIVLLDLEKVIPPEGGMKNE